MLHLILIILTLGMQWCHWQCHPHHMMTKLVPIASPDRKYHVAPHFYCLELRNSIVSLTMHLASHDVDAGICGVT